MGALIAHLFNAAGAASAVRPCLGVPFHRPPAGQPCLPAMFAPRAVLPLSPSIDNFLNVATTCLHGQALLPGRLFSSSAGHSLSGMGSLDLNWLTEGLVGTGHLGDNGE
jgi:hypothetical protein